MEVIKGGTITLISFLQTVDGSPVTGKTLADVLFDINYVDDTAPEAPAAADRELGDGWYAYDFEESEGKDFVWLARDADGLLKNFPGGHVHVKLIEFVESDHNHADTTDEQDVIVEVITTPTILGPFLLDIAALTEMITMRIYSKVDGINYRCIEEADWDPDDTDGLGSGVIKSTHDVKLTIQSAAADGTPTVPYSYYKEVL